MNTSGISGLQGLAIQGLSVQGLGTLGYHREAIWSARQVAPVWKAAQAAR